MDGPADFSSAGSSLPWLWIIEYLAGFKEVDTAILHDLIERAPEIPDDLAKATREMVALRCLEDLFGSSDKVNNDGLSSMEKQVEFGLSESCEDVLQQILQETSASDLKIAGPELLKWDVHPFIKHKRASMPKCALQQLKDTILEGTHPLAASLKESSGLMCVSERGTARVGDLNHNAQAISEKENLLPSTCENRDGRPRDNLHIRNMLPSKRGRGDMAIRDMAEHGNGVQEQCDRNCNTKKHKQDAISNHQSADQISVPTCGKEMVEPRSRRDVAVAGGEGSDISNQSQDEGLMESQFPDDGCDNCDDLRRLGQNGDVNDDQIQHNQAEDGHNVARLPQVEPVQNATIDEANVAEPRPSTGVPSVGTQQKDTVNESRGEVEHSCGEETSSDNDAYHKERIDVAVKKSHFLSSQSALGHDSLATSGWTEENLCVKCNKDGQLLSCSSSTCPLAVHENCLGFPVKFDARGNFHCPFCAYTLSISEYLESKKRASVARKELAAFIQMGSECHQMNLADRLHRKGPGHSRSDGDKDIHENGHLGGRENNQENQNCPLLHGLSDHLCQECGGDKKQAEPLHDVSDHLCQICRANKKRAEPSASCVNANSPCREEEANSFSGRDCVSNGDKVAEEDMVNHCLSERGLEGQPGRTTPECDQPVDHTEAEVELQKEDLEPASSESSDPSENPVIALNIDGEESSEESSESEDDKFIISNYSIRFRRQERHHTYPAIPQLRRKKVPWTAEEEEMLKKGVRRFASVDDRIIPWKKILEFGSSVFFSGRSAIDLKDKWRNMCKGSPKYK